MKIIRVLLTSLYTQFLIICCAIIAIRYITVSNRVATIFIIVISVIYVIVSLYYSIVKKLYRNVSHHLSTILDFDLTGKGIEKLKKYDILKVYNDRIFMLECSHLIDSNQKKDIAAFIDKYLNSRILVDKHCLISFQILRLYFYFMDNSKESYIDLYKKLFSSLSEKDKKNKLKEITIAHLDAMKLILEKKEENIKVVYDAADQQFITNNEKAYRDVFVGYCLKKTEGIEKAKKYLDNSSVNLSSIPFTKYYKSICIKK